MTLKRSAIVGAVTTMLLMGASVGLADRSTVRDSCQEATFLDIQKVSASHSGKRLVHRFQTCDSWRIEDLENKSHLRFRFSTDEDKAYERFVKIDVDDDGRLTAVVSNGRGKVFVGHPDISRPTNSSVKIALSRSVLGSNVSSYRWNAVTVAQGCEDPNDPLGQNQRCFDYSPNGRKVLHEI
jgi:hypothetical protein